MTTTTPARSAAVFDGCPLGAFRVVLSAVDTGGVLTVVEIHEPSGDPPPMCQQLRENVLWMVVEGEASIVVADLRRELRPGDTAFVPAGVRHTCVSGPAGSRLLAVVLAASAGLAVAAAAADAIAPGRATPLVHAGAHFSFEELDVLDDGH